MSKPDSRLILTAMLALAVTHRDEDNDLFREIRFEPEAPDFREVIDFRLERRERQAPRPRDLYRQRKARKP